MTNYNPEALTRVIAEYKAEAAAAERADRDPEFKAGLLEAMLHVVSPTHRTQPCFCGEYNCVGLVDTFPNPYAHPQRGTGVPITYRPEKRSGAGSRNSYDIGNYHRWAKALSEVVVLTTEYAYNEWVPTAEHWDNTSW